MSPTKMFQSSHCVFGSITPTTLNFALRTSPNVEVGEPVGI